MLGKANPRGGHISSAESQNGGWVHRAAPSTEPACACLPACWTAPRIRASRAQTMRCMGRQNANIPTAYRSFLSTPVTKFGPLTGHRSGHISFPSICRTSAEVSKARSSIIGRADWLSARPIPSAKMRAGAEDLPQGLECRVYFHVRGSPKPSG